MLTDTAQSYGDLVPGPEPPLFPEERVGPLAGGVLPYCGSL